MHVLTSAAAASRSCARLVTAVAAVAALSFTACARYREPARVPPAGGYGSYPPGVQVGYASWYGGRLTGRRTADGERFDPREMTAAHRSLPFGTWVQVVRLDNGYAVRVRITDRGPFGHDERIIDLSREAARRLGMLGIGVAPVELWVVAGP